MHFFYTFFSTEMTQKYDSDFKSYDSQFDSLCITYDSQYDSVFKSYDSKFDSVSLIIHLTHSVLLVIHNMTQSYDSQLFL